METILTIKKILSKVLFIILVLLFASFSNNSPKKPENATSFEIQQSINKTYNKTFNTIQKSYKNLNYKVIFKVKNQYIKATKYIAQGEITVYSPPGYSMDFKQGMIIYDPSKSSSNMHIENGMDRHIEAEIWFDEISKKLTMVTIVVNENSTIYKYGNKDSEKNGRNENLEKELRTELEAILK